MDRGLHGLNLISPKEVAPRLSYKRDQIEAEGEEGGMRLKAY